MSAMQELNKRLEELPEYQRELMAATLLAEMDARQWDEQIEADAQAGKLDELVDKAKQDHRAGRTTPLPG